MLYPSWIKRVRMCREYTTPAGWRFFNAYSENYLKSYTMQDEILKLSNQLIEIPSVSGDIKQSVAVLELAENVLKGIPFTPFASQNIPSLLYSNRTKDTRRFKIILNAHLDVVPGTKEQFKPYVKNGRLYGRGAFDMKSSAAVMLLLFQELAQKLSYPLALQLTTDEETGGYYGTKYQIAQGVRGDFIITGEGSNFRIVYEAKGRMIMKLTASGKTAHGGYPWLGENAIWKLQRNLHEILAVYPVPKNESYQTTVNLSTIHTNNTAFNKIPNHCEAVLDIRFIPSEKKRVEKRIRSLLDNDINVDILMKSPAPHETDRDNIYIKNLLRSADRKLPLDKAHATSDIPFYTEVGCDGIEFGPAGGGHHGENEWADIESLDEYYKILKKFLLSVQ